MRHNIKWIWLLALVIALFFGKILFTGQFSVLLERESANQAYAWYNFEVSSIQRGIIPVWDPYALSGHSFVGEMQTAFCAD